MSLRAAFGGIVVGLLAALAIFFWTEYQTGHLWEVLADTRAAASATPPTLVTRPTAARITPPPAQAATRAAPPRPSAAATVPPPPPTAATARGATQVGLSADDLDAELKRQVASGAVPLRNPSLMLIPPDRLMLRGNVPVAVFQVPVELEARLSVDDRGAVRVNTTRVEAVGATLPSGMASALGQQIDEEGSRAVAAALPPGAVARRVAVQPDRVIVELVSGG